MEDLGIRATIGIVGTFGSTVVISQFKIVVGRKPAEVRIRSSESILMYLT